MSAPHADQNGYTTPLTASVPPGWPPAAFDPPTGSLPFGAPQTAPPEHLPRAEGYQQRADFTTQRAARQLKTYLGLAVLSAFLFAPVGIYAMYLAGQVNSRQDVGDVVGAVEASHKARTMSLIALVIGGVIWTVFLAIAITSWVTYDPYSYY